MEWSVLPTKPYLRGDDHQLSPAAREPLPDVGDIEVCYGETCLGLYKYVVRGLGFPLPQCAHPLCVQVDNFFGGPSATIFPRSSQMTRSYREMALGTGVFEGCPNLEVRLPEGSPLASEYPEIFAEVKSSYYF